MKKETILKEIEEFMEKPLDWDNRPDLLNRDVETLTRLVRAIIDQRIERDCDHWSPVDFKIINKMEHKFPCLFPASNNISEKSMHDLQKILREAVSNLRSVTDEVSRVNNVIRERDERDGGTVGRFVREGMHPVKAIMLVRDITPDMAAIDDQFIKKLEEGASFGENNAQYIADRLGVSEDELHPEYYGQKRPFFW